MRQMVDFVRSILGETADTLHAVAAASVIAPRTATKAQRVASNGAASPVVPEKVRQIEDHLMELEKENKIRSRDGRDDNGRDAHYSLVDWSVDSQGRRVAPIYLGSALALLDKPFMNTMGAVLTIIDPERCPQRAAQAELAPGTAHLYLPLDDAVGEPIDKYFEQAYQFIDYHHRQRGVPVFVHCMAGMSRSSTLVAYYLMRKYGFNAIQALDMLKRRRPVVFPNSGFIQRLVLREEASK